MNESKELLEATIKGLEEKLSQLGGELNTKQQELADVNKPELTQLQLDYITEAIDQGINSVDFDIDSFDIEYGIESDGQVYLSHMEFEHVASLVEDIVENLHQTFKIVEDKE